MINKYPYTDFHELNQDWILSVVTELSEKWTTTEAAWLALKSYVENYFNELDVQEEINKKLDEMYEDGSLEELIKGYVDPIYQVYQSSINSTISTQNGKISTLEGRMDEFTNLPEGSTSGDAELADIRVGENGVTYPNAGDAVRGQYNEVNNKLTYYTSKDIVIKSVSNYWTEQGKNIADDGSLIDDSNSYIKLYYVKRGELYKIVTPYKFAFYTDGSASRQLIGVVHSGDSYIEVPENATVLFVSSHQFLEKVNLINFNFYIGNEISNVGSLEETISIGRNSTKTTQNACVAIGHGALENIVESAISENDNGKFNTAVGHHTLNSSTTGDHNTAIGWSAMQGNTTGDGNTALGEDALLTNTDGNGNTAIGHRAMQSHINGSNNTAIGTTAMYWSGSTAEGSNNTVVGYGAGHVSGEGNNNVCIGYWTKTDSGVSNSIAIGASITVNESNQIKIGDGNITSVIIANKKIIFNDDGSVTWEAL